MNSASLAVLIQSASVQRLLLLQANLSIARVILGAIGGSASAQHVSLIDDGGLLVLTLDASQILDGLGLEGAEDTTLDVSRPWLVTLDELQVRVELTIRVQAELDGIAGQVVGDRRSALHGLATKTNVFETKHVQALVDGADHDLGLELDARFRLLRNVVDPEARLGAIVIEVFVADSVFQ